MKKLILIAAAAAAMCACTKEQAQRVTGIKPMSNDAFIKECNKCKAAGYACDSVYEGWTLERVDVRCVEAKR